MIGAECIIMYFLQWRNSKVFEIKNVDMTFMAHCCENWTSPKIVSQRSLTLVYFIYNSFS